VFPGSPWRHLPFLAGCVLPLLWRRRAPVLVLAVVGASSLGWMYVWLGGAQAPIPPFLAQLLAVYTVAATTRGRRFAHGMGVLVLLFVGDLPSLAMGQPPNVVFPGWVLLSLAVVVRSVSRQRLSAGHLPPAPSCGRPSDEHGQEAEAVMAEAEAAGGPQRKGQRQARR
jgi:hypothetical protein